MRDVRMSEERISIVVPVYKVPESYLRKCIESIQCQTYRNIEILLVDDGSPDNCGIICDEYATHDVRVRVIHQVNSGAAAARNTGIKNASGKWIAFVDSDDIVAPMWLEHLWRYADEGTLPMCAYCTKPDDLGKHEQLDVETGRKYKLSSFYDFNMAGIAGYLWNTLFHANIVRKNHLTFRESHERGDYNEDLLFSLQYISMCDSNIASIIYTGYMDYCYCIREDSLSRSYDTFEFEKYQEKYILWKKFLDENVVGDRLMKMESLASASLYRFLTTMNVEAEIGNYQKFRNIVCSDVMQECVRIDSSKENQRIIRLIEKKHSLILWLIYKAKNMKRRSFQ